MADVFARGKGTDNLPLHVLEEENASGEGGEDKNLLLETELNPGDVLFIPAGFPHTTSTTVYNEDDNNSDGDDKTSVHLTFNIDTRVWELDYLNARRLALRRANIIDKALGQSRDEDNVYIGRVNELPKEIHCDLLKEFPLGFINNDDDESSASLSYSSVDTVTTELKRIAHAVDEDTFNSVEESIWKETIEKLKQEGQEYLDIHRDMYIAAIEEGRTRKAERAMKAHIDDKQRKKKVQLTPDQIQRLSLFRVQKYYEKIKTVKTDLLKWSYEGASSSSSASDKKTAPQQALPDNWAYVMPIKVNDEVEADLGGAFFPATITKVLTNGLYDVKFFDGDVEDGMERNLIKLLKPPSADTTGNGDNDGDNDGIDTSNMTPKQLKRWKKAQQKKN